MNQEEKELRLKEMVILYVEDDDITRDACSIMLSRLVKKVHQAENGLDGLNKYREFNPDIIITDIEMPIMNGKEMVKNIKEISPEQPIIVITAFKDEEHHVSSVNKILYKPINKMEVKEVLYSLV